MSQVIKIEKSGLVPATADEVYQVAADVASYPEFLTGLEYVRVQDHTVEMAVRVGALSLVWEQAVSYDPPHSIAFRQIRGPFRRFRGGWNFSPNGQSTCISYYTEFELDLPLPGLGLMLRRTVERNVEQAMAGFRRRLARSLNRDESAFLLVRRCPFKKSLDTPPPV